MGTWEKVAAEKIVRHSLSGTYYLNAKIAGRKIRRSLDTSDLLADREDQVGYDPLWSSLRSGALGRPEDGRKRLSIVEARVAEVHEWKKSAVDRLLPRSDFEVILADIPGPRRRNDNVALMIEFSHSLRFPKAEAAALQ